MGAGPVGASLALALRGEGACLAGSAPAPMLLERETFDSRVYALSPGNVAFLEKLGAWQLIAPERLAPVAAMRVHGDDGRAKLEFDAYGAGVPALAWIVEDAALQRALWSALVAAGVPSFPGQCDSLAFAPEHAELRLSDARTLRARLVIGADGGHSFVRHAAGIGVAERDFGQTAVVANFHCTLPHGGAALQWFQGGPVLALLPLPGTQVSMVWSLPTAEAQRVAALAPEALAAEVTVASGRVLGKLAPASTPRSFPLRRIAARTLVAPRVALAGDAAHVIHPLAGQGLNLGLQDARALAEVLEHREPGRDPGEHRLLRRYERSRAEPILAMDSVVSGLFALYGARSSGIAWLRNAGLNLTDRLAVVKNILMRQAMQ